MSKKNLTAMLSQNVGNQMPSDAASRLIRTDTCRLQKLLATVNAAQVENSYHHTEELLEELLELKLRTTST